jgi:cytochrome c oxidase assembly protein subunit 15
MQPVALLQLAVIGVLVASVPLAWAWVRADNDRYRKLVWITMFLTFDLIMFGAFTRLTDSGLGCPDWPGCYGHSNPLAASAHIDAAQSSMPYGPVTTAKAWIEMLHRYFAMGIGVLILTLAALAWRNRRAFDRSPWPASALVALVCVQGAFGAWTVTLKLMPIIVTIHLLLGIALLCALGRVAEGTRPQTVASPAGQLRGHALLALLVVVMQIALGGWVSTNYAVLACQDFPLCNGALLPDTDFARGFDLTRPLGLNDDGSFLPVQALVAIHWAHRAFALLVTLVAGALAWRMFVASRQVQALRRLALGMGVLLLLQILTGISNVVFAWPLAVAVVHNGGAAALALLLTLLHTRLAQAGQVRVFAAVARAEAG